MDVHDSTIPADDNPMTARFWRKVDRNGPACDFAAGPCWLWTGSHTTAGYGNLNLGGHPAQYGYAHRVSWALANGRDVPAGMQVAHLCGNRGCVNPDHLEAVTQSENERHKHAHGRANYAYGERAGWTKLKDAEVREIRALYVRGRRGAGYKKLAVRFGVGETTIKNIVNGRAWRHLLDTSG